MDIQMYQKHAKRTMNRNLHKDIQLASMGLGLHGELGEVDQLLGTFQQANEVAEEVGDVFWYIANLCTMMGVELEEVISSKPKKMPGLIADTLKFSAYISDAIKKAVAQGHELDQQLIVFYLKKIADTLLAMLKVLELDLGSVLAENHLKLMKRYPIGFDAERSISREEVSQ